MSLADLTPTQRRHLDIAAAEEHQLHRITRHESLTGYDWQRAAALASSIAAQVDQVAVLARTAEQAINWYRSAAKMRSLADRLELWAALADVAVDDNRERT